MNKRLENTWVIAPTDLASCHNSEEIVKFLLRYAILAPSAHNTQPWQCRIKGERVEIFYDQRFALPRSDPTHREAMLSLGCFAANLCLAAKAYGFKVETTWLPEGDDITKSVAHVVIQGLDRAKSIEINSIILDTITTRRVNRGRFTDQQISPTILSDIEKLQTNDCRVYWVTEDSKRERIARLVAEGTKFAFSNPRFRAELSNYIIANNSDRLDGIPGNTAGMNLLRSVVLPKVIERFNIGASQAKTEYDRFMNAPVLLIVSTREDNYRSWLAAGYLFQVIALEITRQQLAYSLSGAAIEPPLSPVVLQKVIGTDSRPQILCCVGHGVSLPPHSPRRPVLDILVP